MLAMQTNKTKHPSIYDYSFALSERRIDSANYANPSNFLRYHQLIFHSSSRLSMAMIRNRGGGGGGRL